MLNVNFDKVLMFGRLPEAILPQGKNWEVHKLFIHTQTNIILPISRCTCKAFKEFDLDEKPQTMVHFLQFVQVFWVYIKKNSTDLPLLEPWADFVPGICSCSEAGCSCNLPWKSLYPPEGTDWTSNGLGWKILVSLPAAGFNGNFVVLHPNC